MGWLCVAWDELGWIGMDWDGLGGGKPKQGMDWDGLGWIWVAGSLIKRNQIGLRRCLWHSLRKSN